MNENLDLTKILKDCPKGTKFYSRCLGSVEFCKITSDNYIEITDKNGYCIRFKPNGIYQHSEEDSEIDLFPSKDQRDWSKWQRPFVDGDVVTDIEGAVIIYQEITTSGYCGSFASLDHRNQFIPHYKAYLDYIRLSTEEEKQKLFDVIKSHGYKWNADKKKLEKLIVPKFKVGDRIKKKGNYISGIITIIDNEGDYKVEYDSGCVSFVNVKVQDYWELVPNKFDVATLKPFDKVLVRDADGVAWRISLFSNVDESKIYRFMCINSVDWEYCIPYNDNTKHLVGKSDEAPEFYRYWEE